MNLQNFLVNTRLVLKDVGVKTLPDPLLVTFANEGKNELYRLIRSTRTDYFLTSSNMTMSAGTPPAPNIITLPADFSQLKDMLCTTLSVTGITFSNPTAIQFLGWDRNDVVFKSLMRSTLSVTDGVGLIMFFDVIGSTEIQVVPCLGAAGGAMVAVNYVAVPADMVVPADTPSTIPAEYHPFITNYMIAEAMRATGDQRLGAYDSKVTALRESIGKSVSTRALGQPQERP